MPTSALERKHEIRHKVPRHKRDVQEHDDRLRFHDCASHPAFLGFFDVKCHSPQNGQAYGHSLSPRLRASLTTSIARSLVL